MMAEKPPKSKEKPIVSSRLPKVFSMHSSPAQASIKPPVPSEYKHTVDLLSPLKVTKRQYDRLHRLMIQADAPQPVVNIVPAAPLRLSDFVVMSALNTSFLGAVNKILHAPSLRMYAVRVLPVSSMEARRSLADWLRIWTLVQEDCEQLIHVETTSWNQPEGYVSIALEYANSGSLQSLMDSLGAIPEGILRGVAGQIAEALRCLHSRNITHGQVSPTQVLLFRAGQVKLDSAAKFHAATRSLQKSNYEALGKRPESTVEEDIFDLGTTLLECAMGGPDWLECLSQPVLVCCVFHTVLQAGIAPLLTRLSAPFQAFLCSCLKFNPAKRAHATDLLTHDWLQRGEAGITVTLRDLLSISFQWAAPLEYRIAAEKQLDRLCEKLKMVLMRTVPQITSSEPLAELALDLGLDEAEVRRKLASIYQIS